ncbi:MAG: flagellar brake protein [Lysobacter sp.]|nr:flagellar brake protein [Lysobacter sp.]
MDVNKAGPTEAEIGVLEALAAQGEVIVTRAAAGTTPFRTRLRLVDPGRRFLLFDRSGDAAADALVLGLSPVDFLVEWGEWRIGFAVANPVAAEHGGAAVIRADFPGSIAISRRRMLPRSAVSPEAALRCVAYSGTVAVWEADVLDVSQGGVGMQAEAKVSSLDPGMVLAASRLVRDGREPVVVDLEVRHTARITLEDGRQVLRIGCRFVNLSPAAMRLVAEFGGARPPA